MRQESFSSLLFYIVQGALTSTIKQEKNKSSRIGKKEPKHSSLVDNVIVYILRKKSEGMFWLGRKKICTQFLMS